MSAVWAFHDLEAGYLEGPKRVVLRRQPRGDGVCVSDMAAVLGTGEVDTSAGSWPELQCARWALIMMGYRSLEDKDISI